MNQIERKVFVAVYQVFKSFAKDCRANIVSLNTYEGIRQATIAVNRAFKHRPPELAYRFAAHLVYMGRLNKRSGMIIGNERKHDISLNFCGAFTVAEGTLAVDWRGRLRFLPRRRHATRYNDDPLNWETPVGKKEDWLMSLLSEQQKKHLFEVQQEVLCV